jgi:hypothetical protein
VGTGFVQAGLDHVVTARQQERAGVPEPDVSVATLVPSSPVPIPASAWA